MKRIIIIPILIIMLAFGVTSAQTKGVGIGIILGEPTGLSMKFWTTSNTAFDIAAAWSFINGSAVHIHADYLYHNFNLVKLDYDKLPFYIGVGGRIKLAEHNDDNQDFRLGIRIPVGLEYIPENIPFDFFMEIAPILDLVPETDFTFNGGIGFRYYFH